MEPSQIGVTDGRSSFLGAAMIRVGDQQAVEVLARARAEGETRGERWWLAETIRMRADADVRFAGGRSAVELRAEAEALAPEQGAELLRARAATGSPAAVR